MTNIKIIIKNYIKKIVNDYLDKELDNKIEKIWNNRYEHLLASSIQTQESIKYEINKVVEDNELPLMSIIRNTVRDEIKKN